MLLVGLALLALVGTAPTWIDRFTFSTNGGIGAIGMTVRFGVLFWLAFVVAGEWILSYHLGSGWMATVNAAAFISYSLLSSKF